MQRIPVIGESAIFQNVLEKVSHLASINRPVLILGARGTGKELIAERLHYLSNRWEKPLIKVNCACLNESLLESELFGHEAGSFTGAVKTRLGRFELANQGTLFLDEIANTSSRLQEAILRVIEYREFERIGGQKTQTCDVRLIAATNVDLRDEVKKGSFRADLLDRISFDVVTMPPLKKRGDDIIELAEFYAIQMAKEIGWPVFPGFSENVINELHDYDWPGNVRELKNVIERSVFHASNNKKLDTLIINPFEPDFLQKEQNNEDSMSLIDQFNACGDLKSFLSHTEKKLIDYALSHCNHHQGNAAKFLGISYHSLRAYLKKHR
jgi:psp operon transcriptional activator